MWKFDEYGAVGLRSRAYYQLIQLSPSKVQWVEDYPLVCDTYGYFYDINTQQCQCKAFRSIIIHSQKN